MNRFRRLGFIDYNGRFQVHKSLLKAVLLDRLPEHKLSHRAFPPNLKSRSGLVGLPSYSRLRDVLPWALLQEALPHCNKSWPIMKDQRGLDYVLRSFRNEFQRPHELVPAVRSQRGAEKWLERPHTRGDRGPVRYRQPVRSPFLARLLPLRPGGSNASIQNIRPLKEANPTRFLLVCLRMRQAIDVFIAQPSTPTTARMDTSSCSPKRSWSVGRPSLGNFIGSHWLP